MKVLLATDGLAPAQEAQALLEFIGDPERLEVKVISVATRGRVDLEHALYALDPIEVRRKNSIAVVEAAVEKLTKAGFKASGATAEGDPGPQLVSFINAQWFDLTLVGSGRASWLGQLLLGSTSSYLLQNSPSSVLVVRHLIDTDGSMKVVFGADGSRNARFARRSFEQFARSDRCVVKAVSFAPSIASWPSPFGLSPEQAEAAERESEVLLEHAQRFADGAATKLRDAGFEADHSAFVGNAPQGLLEQYESLGAGLVVVGATGVGPVRRALLGSTTDAVVRHAPAVLVARRLVS